MVPGNDRVEAIFNSAIEIESDSERQSFIEQACAGDVELLRAVRRLIENHFRAGSFLQPPAQPAHPAGEQPGDMVGPYKLLEKIGEGGFGVVFSAEQRHPMRRLVAVKILKPGMDTTQVLARFEAERQALALMEHPNIARVLDGGATASGRPYFVMELVKGIPITRYCDENHLTNRDRLSLFVPVCHAVQHAHQKGIIHRDIKPANILVTACDGVPVPKVIDFGIAKALGQKLSERTLVTRFAEIIGTLEYMSPEQAEFNAIDVDTRSDIYGLGVLLYELLTGTTPLTRQRIKQAALTDILRLIREEDPPVPSTRLSESRDTLASVSAQRQLDPARLAKEIRGELDWIAMKCLEKERSRRYETANALARDVLRFLNDETVEACPPSAWYRMQKIARRHWRILAAAAAFLLMLVSGVVALSIAYRTANHERQEKQIALAAEAQRRRQTRTALDAMSSQIVEDWLTRQPQLTPDHRSFLELALGYYEEFAKDTGDSEDSREGVADANVRVAEIYELLGQRKDSESAWKKAEEGFATLAAGHPDHPGYRLNLIQVLIRQAGIYGGTGRLAEANAAFDKALAMQLQLVEDAPESEKYQLGLASATTRLAMLCKNTGRLDEAEKLLRQALDIHRKLADANSDPSRRDELGQTLLNLGDLLLVREQLDDAAGVLQQAASLYEQLASETAGNSLHLDMQARSLNNLGNAFRDMEKYGEAERVFRESLLIRRKLAADFPSLPEYSRHLAMAINNLGILYKDTAREDEAEEMYRQATVIHRRLAADFPDVADHRNEAGGAMVNLGRMLLIRQKFEEAQQVLAEGEPHHLAALAASRDNPVYRRFYRLNRWRMAEACIGLKNHVAAAEATQQFFEIAFEPPRDAYTSATLFASCLRLAEEDEQLDPIQRQEKADEYGGRAVAALARAIELKANEISGMATDPALDPLRSRADFQKLLPSSGQ